VTKSKAIKMDGIIGNSGFFNTNRENRPKMVPLMPMTIRKIPIFSGGTKWALPARMKMSATAIPREIIQIVQLSAKMKMAHKWYVPRKESPKNVENAIKLIFISFKSW